MSGTKKQLRPQPAEQIEPDYEGAIAHALGRLENELAPDLVYHNIVHTRNGVMVAAACLAEHSQINSHQARLLSVAAAFHDIGFIENRERHETISVAITAQTLPRFGFGSDQIEQITGMIMATEMPQSPGNFLEEILADADLDILGRPDFFERNELLRQENAAYGQVYTSAEWYREQLAFLRQHRYFTAAARDLRDAGKQANIEAIIKNGLAG